MITDTIFVKIMTFCDDTALMVMVSTMRPFYHRAVQKHINSLTININKLGYERVHLITMLTSLISDQEAIVDIPFSDETTSKINLYSNLIRRSRITGMRRDRLKATLIDLILTRLDNNRMPLISLQSPLDIIIFLHFSRLDYILELSGYFTINEKWTRLIERRAALTAAMSHYKQRIEQKTKH